MGRPQSYNYEIQIGSSAAAVVYPASIGEFGEGEEGRIDVADGDRRYKIRDQIYDIGEIEVVVYLKADMREVNLMDRWAISGDSETVYIRARGEGRDDPSTGVPVGGRTIMAEWELTDVECAMGKKSPFDRNSKAVDTKRYTLLPTEVLRTYPDRPNP
ncbi:MAG: hypothetical protein GY853_01865 [PVC group bacterium]|nr:hypothetical protein [PVC group bacterium]